MFTILEGFQISDRFANFHASCVPGGLVRPFGKFLFLEIKRKRRTFRTSTYKLLFVLKLDVLTILEGFRISDGFENFLSSHFT